MEVTNGPKKGTKTVEVCVARYNETTDWLSQAQFCDFSKVIYNKGPSKVSVKTPENCVIVDLPNVGREGHTFLHHIVTNYDNLADITIFLPGSCMDDGKVHKTNELLKNMQATQDTVISGAWYADVRKKFLNFSIDNWKGTNDANKTLTSNASCEVAEVRPFGVWYKKYFGDLRIEVVSFTSIFAVSSVHILSKSRLYYQNLMCCLDKHPNPEEGHYIERAWVAIFAPLPETCLLAPRPLPPPPRQTIVTSIKALSFIDALALMKNGQKNTDRVDEIRHRYDDEKVDFEGQEKGERKRYNRYCDDESGGGGRSSSREGYDYDRGRNKSSRFS